MTERYNQVQELFDTTPDGIILHDREGKILDANHQATDCLGYSREELTSMSVGDIETSYTDEELQSFWGDMEIDDRETVQGQHRRADGSTFPVELSIRKTVIDGDELYLTLSRDVSERNQRERELERYERLVEDLPIGVYQNTPGPDGEFTLLNDAMVEMFNADSKAELREHAVSDLYVDPTEREAFSDKLAEKGVVREEELELRTLSGDVRWGAVTAIAREVDDKTVFDGAIQDVTERKAYEQQLREQRDNLEILNRVVRHDIRNDLQVVISYAALLADAVDEESDKRAYLETLQQSVRDAVELTKTARDLADVMLADEANQQPRNLQHTLEDEIDSVRSNFPDAVVTVAGSIPRVQVRANELLDSVFRNLLQNAVQHNDKEVAEVTVSVSELDDTVRVRIADNGPGVPDDQKDSIFGKGEKGLDSDGTGVGLYLVQSLVDSYGGAVWVTDNDAEGAVFVVELPAANR